MVFMPVRQERLHGQQLNFRQPLSDPERLHRGVVFHLRVDTDPTSTIRRLVDGGGSLSVRRAVLWCRKGLSEPDADRAFLRDVLGLPNVDVGHGWLIVGLPPAEVAVHPSEKNNIHELYFMCDDIEEFVMR